MFNEPRSGQESVVYIGPNTGDYNMSDDPRTLMLSDSNQNTIARLSNNNQNNTDLQQLNNFLTSDGESDRNGTLYELGTDDRYKIGEMISVRADYKSEGNLIKNNLDQNHNSNSN